MPEVGASLSSLYFQPCMGDRILSLNHTCGHVQPLIQSLWKEMGTGSKHVDDSAGVWEESIRLPVYICFPFLPFARYVFSPHFITSP